MSTEYKDHTKSRSSIDRVGHNASPQVGVEKNTDPALEYAHEHQHSHLHHSAAAMKGREEDVVYSKNTTDEPSTIPRADIMDDALHRRHVTESKDGMHVHDAEKGGLSPSQTESEEDPRRHTLSSLYARSKIFVHLFIWLLFTGLVTLREKCLNIIQSCASFAHVMRWGITEPHLSVLKLVSSLHWKPIC